MEIVYVYQKLRKEFGRAAKFTDFHAEELAETVPEPDRVILLPDFAAPPLALPRASFTSDSTPARGERSLSAVLAGCSQEAGMQQFCEPRPHAWAPSLGVPP